jgi:phospholipase C
MKMLLGLFAALAAALAAPVQGAAAAPPPVKNVWVIVLENKDFDESFGPNSEAPYLANTLRAQGQLLTNYYGTSHFSLGNYITMVSGQAPNPATQGDCMTPFSDIVPGTTGPDGQVVGQGCVYPKAAKTIADQLEAKGLTWRGYMEDMGTPCRHPAIGSQDDTQKARANDQYATRHNPFVYFRSIIDSPTCAKNDVDLKQLVDDVKSPSTTPNYALITPDLCSDGHDTACIDGRPGGLKSIDAFLREWVPRITGSPGFADNGMLVITYDEAEGTSAAASTACCNEPTGPNTPQPGIFGPGGGRVGALVISPFVKAGSTNVTPYNHYSLLRSTEEVFGLDFLGYAGQSGLKSFGADVYNGCIPPTGGSLLSGVKVKARTLLFTARRGGKIRIRYKARGKMGGVGPRRVSACGSYSVKLPKGTTKATVSVDGKRTKYAVT